MIISLRNHILSITKFYKFKKKKKLKSLNAFKPLVHFNYSMVDILCKL